MLRFLSLASASLLALSLVPGCGDIGPSKGEAGVLSFSIRNEDCFVLGCPTDREVVSGSEIAVDVTGFDFTGAADVRIGDPAVATLAGAERACAEASCALNLKIEGRAAGDTRLEVWRSGKLVDATTLRFRAPDRVESVVSAHDGSGWNLAPREGDAFVVQRGARLVLESRALAGDTELIAGKGAFQVTFAQPDTLGKTWVSNVAASKESLEANREGDASVVVATTSGVRTEVRVRVEP